MHSETRQDHELKKGFVAPKLTRYESLERITLTSGGNECTSIDPSVWDGLLQSHPDW
jgi:hypothetical protein